MLWPSTRATWNPNVTMSVAYTAADASVFTQATNSSRQTSRRKPEESARAAAAGALGTVADVGVSGATASKWNRETGLSSSPGSANATASGTPAAAVSATG